MNLDQWLDENLNHLKAEKLFREIPDPSAKPRLVFCSNDYLGLSSHPALKEAAARAARELGAGSGASRLMSGARALHARLEQEAAAWQGKEAALLFTSGYQAAVGIIPPLANGGVIFSDSLNHASIIDGCRLSKARVEVYEHGNVRQLDRLMKAHAGAFPKWIISETVFSMEGEAAPLRELAALKETHQAFLYLDEAHALGIYGENGGGLAHELNLSSKVDLILGTFGKALGSFGAFVAGSRALKGFLTNAARSFIFTTALPSSVTAASLEAVRLVQRMNAERKALRQAGREMRARLRGMSHAVPGEDSPILSVVLGDSGEAIHASKILESDGIWVQPVRPPTVPQGTSRLRVTLTASHSREDLEKLLHALGGIIKAGVS